MPLGKKIKTSIHRRIPLLLIALLATTVLQALCLGSPIPNWLKFGATKDFPFYAKKTAMVWLCRKTTATVYREYHIPPDRWRIEYLAPSSAKGRIVIQKGNTIWQWEPVERKLFITIGDVPTERVESLEPILEQNYKAEVLPGTMTVAGRATIVLKLSPLYPGKSRWLIYVDRETGMILKRERTTAKGDYELISECEEFKPGPVDPRMFDPKELPPGKVVKRTWSGKRVSLCNLKRLIGRTLPSKLSGGFRVNSASVVRSSPLTAQLTYTDGLATVSLFASVRKEGSLRDCSKYKTSTFGHLASISWHADGITYTLVGDVSQQVLLDIAESLKR